MRLEDYTEISEKAPENVFVIGEGYIKEDYVALNFLSDDD